MVDLNITDDLSKNTDNNFGTLVKEEINTIKAFKTAQGLLVSQYGNIIEKLYEFAPIIIAIRDVSKENGPFIYINKYAEQELGYPLNEMIQGGTRFLMSLFHPDDSLEAYKKTDNFIRSLSAFTNEESEQIVLEFVKRIRNSEGNFLWFNFRNTLISRKSDGSPHLVMTIMSNVNDSIELQEQRQKTLNLEISLLRQKVKAQNEQLQTQLLSSIESNQCYDDVVKFIRNISSEFSEEEQRPFEQVISYINRNKPSVNVWEEFVERFQDINPNFVNKVSKKHPDLTPTELKIISLTRTGLNSKDISSILKISIRSVENHKYNIRRKFDLEPYQNLYNYINSL